MRARSPTGSASRTTCSITRAHSARTWSSASPTITSPGAPRFRASAATWGPSSPTCWRMARELGADCLATGHYVRRVAGRGGPGTAPRARSGARPVVFPLRAPPRRSSISCAFRSAACPSSEVRAHRRRLSACAVAAKPDSQDICFVPDGDYAEIVRTLRPEGARPGRDRPCRDRRGAGRARRA